MDYCSNCKFFAKVYTGLKSEPGECRRREPTVLPNHQSAWPRVLPRYWCGEYQPKVSG